MSDAPVSQPTVLGHEPAGETIICPEPGCGRTLQLMQTANKPGRVSAYCNHGIPTRAVVAVYEADAPQAPSSPASAKLDPMDAVTANDAGKGV